MNRQPLQVVFAGKWLALVSGYGSRELLMELRGGKSPIRNATRRAWATTPKVAADFIAVAESRDRMVLVINEDSDTVQQVAPKDTLPLAAEEIAGLFDLGDGAP